MKGCRMNAKQQKLLIIISFMSSFMILASAFSLHAMDKQPSLLGKDAMSDYGVTEKTLASINSQQSYFHELLDSYNVSDELHKLGARISLENDQECISPSPDDLCSHKECAIKTAVTLSLALLLDGGMSAIGAPIFFACGTNPSLVCGPLCQSILCPFSCCICWCRRGLRTMSCR